MLRVMTSKKYFLEMRDIVRQSSSFCSMLSSAMRRLYYRAWEKNNASFAFEGVVGVEV